MENEQTHTQTVQETITKKPRGRPAKYAKEEREQKYKELTKQWRQEHKDECNKHSQNYYREHSDQVYKSTLEYQYRARHALKLLSEMFDNNQIEIKDERYKLSVLELIKNKKVITI